MEYSRVKFCLHLIFHYIKWSINFHFIYSIREMRRTFEINIWILDLVKDLELDLMNVTNFLTHERHCPFACSSYHQVEIELESAANSISISWLNRKV